MQLERLVFAAYGAYGATPVATRGENKRAFNTIQHASWEKSFFLPWRFVLLCAFVNFRKNETETLISHPGSFVCKRLMGDTFSALILAAPVTYGSVAAPVTYGAAAPVTYGATHAIAGFFCTFCIFQFQSLSKSPLTLLFPLLPYSVLRNDNQGGP